MQPPEPQAEHQWLQQLVGEWTFEHEADPSKPAEACRGSEVVRPIGNLWIICEMTAPMPNAPEPMRAAMTLGYNPDKKRFEGTFIASMMNGLWIYEGQLNDSRDRLDLYTTGPSFSSPGKTAPYRDTIELQGNGRRTLTSHVQGDDGQWQRFMKASYQRVR